MLRALSFASVVSALLLVGCSSIKTVVLPGAATLKEGESALIWKEYKGMWVSVDGNPDTNSEIFTRYTVAPGKHPVDVTILRLIKDTGYVYSGKPLTWSGTVDAKAGHRYLIMARENSGATAIQLFMQDQDPPDYENVNDVELGELSVKQ